MVKLGSIAVAVASLCQVGCLAMDEETDVDLVQLETKVVTHALGADSSPESALIIVVPAANVASYVPAGYSVLTIPGAAEGADGALLWVFSGRQTNVTTDGTPVGDDLLVHVAVQINEPPPPPGKTLVPGAAHLYEIRLIFDNHAAASWGHSKVGEPTVFSNGMHFAQQDPGVGPGFISMAVDPPQGGFTYVAQYGPLAPFPPPLSYTWYEGDHGLAFSEAVFENLQAAGAGGQVCADAGSWMSDILGLPCRGGGGLALTGHVTLTWTVYFPEDD